MNIYFVAKNVTNMFFVQYILLFKNTTPLELRIDTFKIVNWVVLFIINDEIFKIYSVGN